MIAVATAAVIEMPVAPAVAHMGLPVIGGGAGGGEVTCDTELVSDTGNNDYWSSNSVTVALVGQGGFVPASNATICSVTFSIHSYNGSYSNYDVTARVYDFDGTDLDGLVTGDCTSDTTNISGTGEVTFTGLSCSIVTTGTYAIVFGRTDDTADGTDYIQFDSSTSSPDLSGNTMLFHGATSERSLNAQTQDAYMTINVE